MDTENQQGGLVAKAKNTNQNPRKVMQSQINEIGGATSSIITELRNINQHLMGLEALVLHLAEFRGEKEEFEKYVEGKIKELEETKPKEKAKVIKKK